MKIIDLLNKIANGEELPKKIKFNHIEYHLIDDYYVDDGDSDLFVYIFRHNIDFSVNDEVEILDDEEKGLPEKLEGIDSLFEIGQDLDLKSFLAWQKANNKMIENKINEIIDYLEKQRKGE